jgi:hypothetical protein
METLYLAEFRLLNNYIMVNYNLATRKGGEGRGARERTKWLMFVKAYNQRAQLSLKLTYS